jgi:hypothetical protein
MTKTSLRVRYETVTKIFVSSLYDIVKDLLRVLLRNGSVNKPQPKNCFLYGPSRDRR